MDLTSGFSYILYLPRSSGLRFSSHFLISSGELRSADSVVAGGAGGFGKDVVGHKDGRIGSQSQGDGVRGPGIDRDHLPVDIQENQGIERYCP